LRPLASELFHLVIVKRAYLDCGDGVRRKKAFRQPIAQGLNTAASHRGKNFPANEGGIVENNFYEIGHDPAMTHFNTIQSIDA
jgi:hypothetical protein